MLGVKSRRADQGGGFTDVAAGASHSCGLKMDGTVQCWGRNSLGADQLTPPTNSDNSAIVFSAIDSSGRYTCGIRADNAGAVCWGNNRFGQVTRMPPPGSTQAILNANLSYDYSMDSFFDISTGHEHTCGVLQGGANAGQIRCWGSDVTDESTVPTDHASTVFKSVESGGTRFTCGLIGAGSDDGTAVCWGNDFHSVVTQTPETERFSQISAGFNYACGIKTDGTMQCWGGVKNPLGPVIDVGQFTVPTEHQDFTFSAMIAATYHTCGILDGQNEQTEGEVVCWGAEFEYDPLTS